MADSTRSSILRNYVNSSYIDFLAALLILLTCIFRDFLGTIYVQGEMRYGTPLYELWDHIMMGAYPLGVMSTVGAVFSLLSTRLIGKQNNWGNLISILTTINSGVNDYLFGNRSAIITYPITFFLHSFATYKWSKGSKIRNIDGLYYMIVAINLVLGYTLVYWGFTWFGGYDNTVFFHTVAITFGISLGANSANIFKYKETWMSWTIYNILQLIKNSIQLNIANVAKYTFYLFNAVITFFDWKINGDTDKPAREL